MSKFNKVLILGFRSFLSQALKKKLPSALLIKSREIDSFQNKLDKNLSYTVIINLFYPTFFLKNLNKKKFNYYSENLIFKFLNKLTKYKIKRIIYTSSSIANYSNLSKVSPRYNYQKKKKEMELKIKNFCKRNKIFYTITRPYNIYGEGDKFSIISKLKKLKLNKIKKLEISNQGNSVRDFINIKDVVSIYKKIIKFNINGIISIGTGKGVKIFFLINLLKLKKKVIFLPKNKHEIKTSVCNTKKLNKIINIKKFVNLKNYLNIKC